MVDVDGVVDGVVDVDGVVAGSQVAPVPDGSNPAPLANEGLMKAILEVCQLHQCLTPIDWSIISSPNVCSFSRTRTAFCSSWRAIEANSSTSRNPSPNSFNVSLAS